MKHTLINRRKYYIILEIDPSLPDIPSASDEHQCTAVVQGRALRHSNLYFFADQLKLSTPSLQKRLNINNGTSWWNIHWQREALALLHWKWNDREDTRSILTVLLLHFISDTRVEQVANEVYRALQGWRPGVLRLGCWSWLFQSLSSPWCFCGSIWVVIQTWSS